MYICIIYGLDKNTTASPLYYVRGGDINVSTGSVRNVSINNNYWSSTTYPNTTYAYVFYFGNTNVYLSDHNNRFLGFSVGRIAPLTNSIPPTPLYYMRGGIISLNIGSLRYAGNDSNYWSATIYPNNMYAYRLLFNNADVYPSYYNDRFSGFSVRFYTRRTHRSKYWFIEICRLHWPLLVCYHLF